MNSILDGLGKRLAQFLDKPLTHYDSIDTVGELELADILQPCDMLLIEGNTHICHPVNLTDTDRGLLASVLNEIGHTCDLNHRPAPVFRTDAHARAYPPAHARLWQWRPHEGHLLTHCPGISAHPLPDSAASRCTMLRKRVPDAASLQPLYTKRF